MRPRSCLRQCRGHIRCRQSNRLVPGRPLGWLPTLAGRAWRCRVDPYGEPLGYEDAFTKLAAASRHYEALGLGESFVEQFIR
jgi:hypothetical protein